jgi:hypothetical protein
MARISAGLAALDGDALRAESSFKAALGRYREIRMPFWLGVALLEYGEWLAGDGRMDEAEPLLVEARQVFGRLRATPWLDRLGSLPAQLGQVTA